MKKFKFQLTVFLSVFFILTPFLHSQSSLPPEATVKIKPAEPLVTKECLLYDDFNNCREWNYTYSVKQVSCTEDCVEWDSFHACKFRNKCRYDQGSGCFVKKTCVEFKDLNRCKNWREDPVCQ